MKKILAKLVDLLLTFLCTLLGFYIGLKLWEVFPI